MKNNKPLASFNPELIKPYLHGAHDTALEYIEALEKEVEQLRKGIAAEKRRADAAVEDLKYYLENNEENGVVYLPKFVIERLVNRRAQQEAGEGGKDG